MNNINNGMNQQPMGYNPNVPPTTPPMNPMGTGPTSNQYEQLLQQMKDIQDSNDRKRKKNKKIIIILIIIALLLCGGLGIYIATGNLGPQYDKSATYGDFSNLSEQEKQDKLNELQERSMMDLSCTSLMKVDSGSDMCLAKIQNKNTEETNHPWDQKVTISLVNEDDNTEEVLYQSDLIKPGQILEYVQLNRTLPDGSYPVNVTFQAYDIDTHELSGNSSVRVRMNVG